jgi:hypothetical protein
MLERLARNAEVVKLTVGIGEPFLGLTNGEKDRWLPEVCISEYKNPHHHILLSSPVVTLADDAHNTACQHSLITAWRNFFARKYPSLAFRTIPLYTNPTFPRVWTDTEPQYVDVSSELQNTLASSTEVVEILISWIGRALIANALQQDEASTRWCAGSSLRIYANLRPDLVHAINTTLLDDVAHGLQGWDEWMEQAKCFLYDALRELREKARADEQFVIDFGDKPTPGKASADHWLPHVGSKMHEAEPGPCTTPLCVAVAEDNKV